MKHQHHLKHVIKTKIIYLTYVYMNNNKKKRGRPPKINIQNLSSNNKLDDKKPNSDNHKITVVKKTIIINVLD